MSNRFSHIHIFMIFAVFAGALLFLGVQANSPAGLAQAENSYDAEYPSLQDILMNKILEEPKVGRAYTEPVIGNTPSFWKILTGAVLLLTALVMMVFAFRKKSPVRRSYARSLNHAALDHLMKEVEKQKEKSSKR